MSPQHVYGKKSIVKGSLLANGCVIEGTVENSILFRGVHVHKDAVVRNSIIMQRCNIQEGTVIRKCHSQTKILSSLQTERL